MEAYHWSTEDPLFDNHLTLCDYLDNELDEHLGEDTYFEVIGTNEATINHNGVWYVITAMGCGDSVNHRVEFTEYREDER